ncbi:hypothetical protein [Rummeliibacillus sp. BSL5]
MEKFKGFIILLLSLSSFALVYSTLESKNPSEAKATCYPAKDCNAKKYELGHKVTIKKTYTKKELKTYKEFNKFLKGVSNVALGPAISGAAGFGASSKVKAGARAGGVSVFIWGIGKISSLQEKKFGSYLKKIKNKKHNKLIISKTYQMQEVKTASSYGNYVTTEKRLVLIKTTYSTKK